MASVSEVLKVALTGEGLIPPASERNSACRTLTIQGWVYFMMGVLLFFAPGVFNKLAMFPESFTDEETPCYRMIGFTLIGIGYFYIMASRINNHYWAVTTIVESMTLVPVGAMTMYLLYGAPPQLCITFAILVPTLAIWTYVAMKKDLKDPSLTMGKVLAMLFNGGGLIPSSNLSWTARALILQGLTYFSTGCLIFFLPEVFNMMMMFPEPFSDAVTPLYRMIGFGVIIIGYFYIMASRMDHMFWATATIFTRMTMTPFSCMTLFLVYGGAPQLCVTFSILDPTLAYWTYTTLKDKLPLSYEAIQ